MAASTTEIQSTAQGLAASFLRNASEALDAKIAADWSLAAKNAIQVSLTCEQIVKTRNARH